MPSTLLLMNTLTSNIPTPTNRVPFTWTWLVQGGTRAAGYGDMPEGIPVRAQPSTPGVTGVTINSILLEAGTADSSGSANTIALYSGTGGATGTAVSGGSTTLTTGSSAGVTATITGPFIFLAGTWIQINITSLSTGTPGARLYATATGTWNA